MKQSFENIKKSSVKTRWSLREVHKIMQWKNGCVYKTKSLGMISCSPDYAQLLSDTDKNIFVGSISTSVSKLIESR